MSQASRSHVEARARHREQVARFIVDAWPEVRLYANGRDAGSVPFACVDDVLAGDLTFDVAAVRLAAQRELAEAELMALVLGDECRAWGPEWSSAVSRLPAWAPTAPARARVARRVLDMLDARPGTMWEHAKRQPSGCQSIACDGGHDRHVFGLVADIEARGHDVGHLRTECYACRGTGHNLRGTLPPLWASPAVRRRRADQGLDEDGQRTGETWLDDPAVTGYMGPGWALFVLRPGGGPRVHTPEELATGAKGLTTSTRAVARGEHRDVRSFFSPFTSPTWPESTLDERITSRALSGVYFYPDKWPRWRRGELRHDRRRKLERIAEDQVKVAS